MFLVRYERAVFVTHTVLQQVLRQLHSSAVCDGTGTGLLGWGLCSLRA